MKEILKRLFNRKQIEIEPGETELDFIPPHELKPLKKKVTKKENPIVKVQKNNK